MNQLRDISLLVARIVIGLVFVVRAYWLVDNLLFSDSRLFGIDDSIPPIVLWLTAVLSVVGGLCFAAGVLLPVAGLILALVTLTSMLPASLATGYYPAGVPATYVLVIAVTCVAIGLNGGALTVHSALARLRSGRAMVSRR